jgi:lysozyme-like protein/carbohydrate binding protein with CBM5/12 domain
MGLTRRAVRAAVVFAAAAAGTLLAAPAHAASPVGPAAVCQQQSFLEGQHLSDVRIAELARDAGFRGEDWVISVAVAKAESAGWTRARLINTDCSVDRGLWQINGFWHSEVSDACAFDPACAARSTRTIQANRGWTEWVTFTNGAYQAHMAAARAAVNQVGGGGGNPPPPPPPPPGGGGTWAPNVAYAVGARVTYAGHTYTCLQGHTSLPGWEPPNVPALWRA